MGASRLTTEDAEGAENFSFSGYYVFTVVSFIRLQPLTLASLTGPVCYDAGGKVCSLTKPTTVNT